MPTLLLRRPLPVSPVLPSSAIKRGLDLLLIVLTLPIWGPLLLLLACAVAVDGGAVFHAQQRAGRDGRLFRMWKLRSMHVGAEGQLAALLADPGRRQEWMRHGKLTADPRVTRLGRWLRRHSLDELPQVWNVIRGDMAIVGPRPLLPDEIAREYGAAAHAVLSVRPGMTGPWQVAGSVGVNHGFGGPVSGRNGLRYADRLRMDLAYVQQHNLPGDLAIMLRTCAAILRGTGR